MTSTESQLDTDMSAPLSVDDVVSILEDWGRTHAPSRFMVYGVTDDPADGGHEGDVIAWGLRFHDHVYVQTERSRTSGRFSSVETMRRILFRRDRDIRLVWIDPEPDGGTDARLAV
jgi:hypothetical protein